MFSNRDVRFYNHVNLVLLFIAWITICFSPISTWLESDIRLHMLVQLPALVLLGYFLCKQLVPNWTVNSTSKQPGAASVVLALFVTIYWMIPKSLDAALTYEIHSYIKYLSIPLLIGVPLALGWHQVGSIFRGFVIIELIAMLLRLGWLYRDSPIRLCSNYGLYEQNSLGNYF